MYRLFDLGASSRRKQDGFTLIELLVVIAIIGILAGTLLAILGGVRSKARDARRVGEFHEITVALELYNDAHGQYPPVLNGHPTAEPCDPDPDCAALADANWNDMISRLKADKDLAMAPMPMSLPEKIAQLILPQAFASTPYQYYQDPLYPNQRFEYMSSGPPQPLNKNYRIRAEMENLDNPVLKNSLTGGFYWADTPTGPDACDQDPENTDGHAYYCAGPVDDFTAFDPGKPVIYLYPTHTEMVSVNVHARSIDESIPAYGDGWSVLAHPNGQLQDIGGVSYPYLYWEGRSEKPIVDRSKGFVVANADIRAFLAEVLRKQGLTDAESKEFIEYWAPRMEGKPYVYVYFMPKSDYDKLIPMDISPKPDTMIRVYMLWRQLDAPIAVTPETFETPKRVGFTAVEWGGDRSQLR
jgi:prepilin-type N-terminal cleavage/methylation domain-containing protein